MLSNISKADHEALFKSAADALFVKHVAEQEELAQTYLYMMKQSYSTGECLVADGVLVLS